MKKRSILFLCMVLCFQFPVSAQDTETAEASKAINKVKLDGAYVWAEGTSQKSAKEALENAHAVLNFEIQNWLKAAGQEDVGGVVMPTSDECQKIQTTRRKLYRAFVYVEKNKIVPYAKDTKVVVVERTEPKPEKKAEKKPEPEKPLVSKVEPVLTDFERSMLEVKTSDDIKIFAGQSNIAQHGKYKNRPQSGVYYIFIYNREGQVPARLKCVEGSLTNLATGRADSFDNYKGCGGYWVIEKSK